MDKKKSMLAVALSIALGFGSFVAAQQTPPRPPAQKPPATVEQQKPAQPPAQKPPAAVQQQKPPAVPAVNTAPQAKPSQPALPSDFVLGPDDVVHVEFWRDKDMSSDATVRPDGKITLPLLNDVQAGGLTPDQLRDKIIEQATRLIQDPSATVVVKEIRSRKVFITGEVNKPGAYLLNDRMTVLQLIATAGGLTEYAKKSKIVIMRNDAAGPVTFPFNYSQVLDRKNLQQNIELRPGDTVIVP
jgi:polysaccharide export outer membrane protein